MKAEYREWIDKHVPDSRTARGRCQSFVREMHKAFPELQVQRGWYVCPIWGKRTHWWLLDEDGNVVDPTVTQFPSHAMACDGWYEAIPAHEIQHRVPSGRCRECGEEVFRGDVFCSRECTDDYVKSLGALVKKYQEGELDGTREAVSVDTA